MSSRFSPQLRVLNYTEGKEAREELRERLTTQQEWNGARCPFHILLTHYEVLSTLLMQSTKLVADIIFLPRQILLLHKSSASRLIMVYLISGN